MKSFPIPLTAKEESILLERMNTGPEASDGELLQAKEARNELIERNLRLVAHIVKKYNHADRDMDDLISIGTIGLIKAVDTYNADKGIRLATYASRCIDNPTLTQKRYRMMRKGLLLIKTLAGDCLPVFPGIFI